MSGISQQKLSQHVAAGIVRSAAHPHLPLTIYNYTERCQYDKLWDDLALKCRGLIMYGDQIVARPFGKFFNDTEHDPSEIPWHLPCEVTEKLDGSLLIAFNFLGEWHTATRGSFISEQSYIGRNMLEAMGLRLDPEITYLFEIIYPENRIVVNYGSRREIVLLAMVDRYTGVEISLDHAPTGVKVVRRLPPTANAQDLRSIIRDDEEGYVVRFSNGFRIKVKGERYMQLHRTISGLSSRMVWEFMSQDRDLAEVLAVVPDEFAEWVRDESELIQAAFDRTKRRADDAFDAVKYLPTRKDKALTLLEDWSDVSSMAFLLMDGKDPSQAIWKAIYPELRRPETTQRLVGGAT